MINVRTNFDRWLQRLLIGLAIVQPYSMSLLAQEPTLPSSARQTEIRADLETAFSVSKAETAEQKRKVISDLNTLANDPAVSSDELFVMLQTIAQLSVELQDASALQTATGKLSEKFPTNAMMENARHFYNFMSACKSKSVFDSISGDVLILVDKMIVNARVREAQILFTAAEKCGERLQSKLFSKQLSATKVRLEEAAQWFNKKEAAIKTLEFAPEDAEANYHLGYWLAIFANDWNAALPRLAKGSELTWQAAAKAELAATNDIDSRLAAADAWWNVVQEANETVKEKCQRKTFDMYTRLEPEITSSLRRALVTKRKAELAAALNPHQEANGTGLVEKMVKEVESKTKLVGRRKDLIQKYIGVELLNNPSCEMPMVAYQIPGWTKVSGNWQVRGGDPSPNHGDGYFYAETCSIGEIKQIILLKDLETEIDAGKIRCNFSAFVRSWPQKNPDACEVVIEFVGGMKHGEIQRFQSGQTTSVNQWQNVSDSRILPNGTRAISVRLISTRREGKNNDGYFDNLSLKLSFIED